LIIHGVDTNKLAMQAKRMALQTRHRSVMRSRLWYGFVRLFSQPLTLIFPILLAAVVAVAWLNRDAIPLPSGEAFPGLVEVWQMTLAALIIVFAFLALWGILVLLGTPHHAKKTDAALVRIGLVDRYDLGPALLHIDSVKGTEVSRMEFLSQGISMEVWEDRERAICDALNVHFVEPPSYGGRKGNNRSYILITVAPGAEISQANTLYDEL